MEIKFTRTICNDIKAINGVVFAIVGGEKQEPGWPDRFVCHKRWHGFIEFKGPKTRVGTKQRIVLRRLRERGCNAVIVREPDRIEDPEGELLATFDGTGRGLIKQLRLMDPLKGLIDAAANSDDPIVVAAVHALGNRRGL